ncbi:glycosyltransferase family 2 protein [Sphingobacterium multivorum]|uniref:glycosyltransferase family 2 protein n=1 Tax=Sphingobacterium multivorum TaxID=28454 RepID=UPI000E9299C6|nr:glycosyltransferase family 2 protein [Sphingobacterium multivorum]QQT63618.1 glycosyltransferase family 2 protein [Sphingobacterium multivorum]HBI87704.1 hypothetical protein [Sphingobacterium sp.]
MIVITIPVYNGAKTISKSLDSLISQTFKNWIAIIVNDGSIDNTSEILEKYSSDNRFIILNEATNRGRGYARNLALNTAYKFNPKYLCMLDADDVYHPEKLSRQYKFMEDNLNITLLSNAVGLVNRYGNLYSVSKSNNNFQFYFFKDYENYCYVPHASSIVRFCDIDVIFDESMRFSEDQDFMIRLLKEKEYAFDPNLLYYYYRDESFSINKYKASLNATIYSMSKLHMSKKYLLGLKLVSAIKLILFSILSLIGLDSIYFKKAGSNPDENEILEFSKIIL